MFQSLSREKPFCHIARTLTTGLRIPGFNRSVAKSPFATSLRVLLCRLQYASFNRSVAKSPSSIPSSISDGFNRSVAKSPFATSSCPCPKGEESKFQSLSREKPFCHPLLLHRRVRFLLVSIAQSRKALLPPHNALA